MSQTPSQTSNGRTLPEKSQRRFYVDTMQTREAMFKDHIRGHNRHMRDEYYMLPKELEELLNTGSYDAALTAVGEHKDKQTEFNRQHFELGRRFGTT